MVTRGTRCAPSIKFFKANISSLSRLQAADSSGSSAERTNGIIIWKSRITRILSAACLTNELVFCCVPPFYIMPARKLNDDANAMRWHKDTREDANTHAGLFFLPISLEQRRELFAIQTKLEAVAECVTWCTRWLLVFFLVRGKYCPTLWQTINCFQTDSSKWIIYNWPIFP